MFEFSLPEDLTICSAQDLQECITEAKREFHALNDSDDLSDEVLDRMTSLADGIEALHAQLSSRRVALATRVKRVELAPKLEELAKKAFPGAAPPFPKKGAKKAGKVEMAAAVTKSEGDAGDFPASDFAYVPDAQSPSTWKLRLTASPGGDPDPHIVGAAIAALGPGGFRGQKVQIPADDLDKVKAKVAAAWTKANPDKSKDDMPTFGLSRLSDFGSLPPALAKGIIKKLQAELAAEKDPDKKAAIEARIKKLGGDAPKDEAAAAAA